MKRSFVLYKAENIKLRSNKFAAERVRFFKINRGGHSRSIILCILVFLVFAKRFGINSSFSLAVRNYKEMRYYRLVHNSQARLSRGAFITRSSNAAALSSGIF